MLGTMPESALKSMEQRSTEAFRAKLIRDCIATMTEKLEAGISVTEVLDLPAAAESASGQIPVTFAESLGIPELTYTAAELRMQLIQVVRLLEQYPNYHIVLAAVVPENVDVVVAEEAALLVRTGSGGKAFFFPMNRAATALWKYMENYTARENRESTIRKLNEMIFEIGNCGASVGGKAQNHS